MAARTPRRREALLAFDALHIEGGLLAPEWLARAARLDAPHQSEADYRIPRGLNLRDEIGRSWRIAQAHHAEYLAGRARKADPAALSSRFVSALLRQVLGFDSLVAVPPVVVGERSYPIGLAALGGKVPVVVAPAGAGLDAPHPAFGEGGKRRSAFGLAQEALNASPEMLWALACDGERLRIARDNASLTRPSWIEADLGRIFAEERFADFAALWLIAHETRFGTAESKPEDCPLEAWREAGRQEGTRALGQLRVGVKDALEALGQGFLAHPDNQALRAALEDGSLSRRDYFQQLLRLAYRLIFLLTVEERGLLHPERTPAAARKLYEDGYALRRLRERSARRSAHDQHDDLWDGLGVVLRGLDQGQPLLGLPGLAGLFAARQCPALDAARLQNRHLLMAIFRLSWMRDTAGLSRVNWRDMGPEELGSVYESLLELEPEVSVASRRFAFAEGLQGNARKTTGSYYTPDSLVQVLLDSAFEPVVADTLAAHPDRPVEALLSLSIVDPACGSGHFLLAAARRLAAHVARVEAEGTPTAAEYRHALRRVVGRCIYGVDINPMAVELCTVALWMEAVEPGLPLGFLDAHIRCGNALLGATPELMEEGIPDNAWSPIEGDDRKTASSLKKRNKQEGSGQQTMVSMWAKKAEGEAEALRAAVAALEAAPDSDAKALAKKEARWAELQQSAAWKHQHLVADAWCAAFAWPKPEGGGPVVEVAPTNAAWRDLRDGRGTPPALMVETIAGIAAQHRFFHWHLAFPTVFERGGFDVVLGNPPWERVKLQEQEFFAGKSPEIAGAANAAARKKLIAALPETDLGMWLEWCAASREAQAQSHFVRNGGRYPLCGKGDVNTYALFAEHNRALLGKRGRAGFIVPTGIATDDTTKEYFGALVAGNELARFLSFENESFIFPEVHHVFKFALLTIDGAGHSGQADLAFFARQVSELADQSRHFTLSAGDFVALNPNTRTCPTFRSRRDADLNLAMYRRAGVLWLEGPPEANPWGLRFMRMLDMANDSGLFHTCERLEAEGWTLAGNRFVHGNQVMLPLYEAKMMHFFDHRLGTYDGQSEGQANQGVLPHLTDDQHDQPALAVQPRYWVEQSEVANCLVDRWGRGWLFGFRDVARATEYRTCICGVVPRVAVGHKLPLMLPGAEPAFALFANLSSFVLDYACRQKFSGASLALFVLRQLPVLPPSTYAERASWDATTDIAAWLLPRVLELTYTAWDLEPFARDLGHDGPPFRWDSARRAQLRAELDAAFFHLYSIARDDVDYIMESFFVVRKYDERDHSEYRTKRLILEAYDTLAEATRTGQAYVSSLDPPPADPRVAHDPFTRPDWAPEPAR